MLSWSSLSYSDFVDDIVIPENSDLAPENILIKVKNHQSCFFLSDFTVFDVNNKWFNKSKLWRKEQGKEVWEGSWDMSLLQYGPPLCLLPVWLLTKGNCCLCCCLFIDTCLAFPLQPDSTIRQSKDTGERLKVIPKFCFPDPKDWGLTSESKRSVIWKLAFLLSLRLLWMGCLGMVHILEHVLNWRLNYDSGGRRSWPESSSY